MSVSGCSSKLGLLASCIIPSAVEMQHVGKSFLVFFSCLSALKKDYSVFSTCKSNIAKLFCSSVTELVQAPSCSMCCAAGFISFAGNWQGQGSVYSQFLAGASLFDNRAYAASALAYESWPSTYISASNPAFYGASEVIVRTTNATGKSCISVQMHQAL